MVASVSFLRASTRAVRRVAASSVATALLLGSLSASATAQGREGVEAGLLTCHSVPGTRINLLIHSAIDVRCVFKTASGKVEYYRGTTGVAFGLDVNWDRSEAIAFSVVGGARDISPGAYSLTGRYVGGKASITAGEGIGAAALIGGSRNNIALEPLALETSTGLGLAAGVAYLSLKPDKSGSGNAAHSPPPQSSAATSPPKDGQASDVTGHVEREPSVRSQPLEGPRPLQ